MAPTKTAVKRGKPTKRPSKSTGPLMKNPYGTRNAKKTNQERSPTKITPTKSKKKKPSSKEVSIHEVSPHSKADKSANRSDTSLRVSVLEDDVKDIKGQVGTIHQKLDLILETNISRDISKDHSTPRKPPPAPHAGPAINPTQAQPSAGPFHRDDPHRCPTAADLFRLPGASNFVNHQLMKEAYQPQATDGKAMFINNPFQKQLLAKPYMYLERTGCTTLRQKLDARHSMTTLEYIDALTTLIKRKDIYPSESFPFMMDHLSDVTKDAKQRNWAGVLTWSQFVFDSIERDDFSWGDWHKVQQARNMYCFAPAMAPGRSSAPGSQPYQGNYNARPTQSQSTQGVSFSELCTAYNSQNGCSQRSHHAGSYHYCSYCYDKADKICTHPVSRCDRKYKEVNGGRSQFDRGTQPGQNNNNQHAGTWRSANDRPAPHMAQSASKNA